MHNINWMDKNEVLHFIKTDSTGADAIRYIRHPANDDFDVAMEVVKQNGNYLRFMGENCRNNKEVVLTAVKKTGEALQYASARLKNDKEVVMAAVSSSRHALKFIGSNLYHDKEVVLASINHDVYSCQYMNLAFSDDKEVIMVAVSKHSGMLEYASDRLKDDEEVVLASLTATIKTKIDFMFVSHRLRNNIDFCIECAKLDSNIIRFFLGDVSKLFTLHHDNVEAVEQQRKNSILLNKLKTTSIIPQEDIFKRKIIQ
jgi:hypothetical protein